MRNNKLWSVLLAAVLLCACVVGVLFVGAQAGDNVNYVNYVVDSTNTAVEGATVFSTFKAAIAEAATLTGDKTLPANSHLVITLKNDTEFASASDANGKFGGGNTRNFFALNTLWMGSGDTLAKLPITIQGENAEGTAQIKLSWTGAGSQMMTFANDYIFSNLDLSTWSARSGRTDTSVAYAANSKVQFNNCEFGTNQRLTLSADNYLYYGGSEAYAGWTEECLNAVLETDKDGKKFLTASITFGSGTHFGPATGPETGNKAGVQVRATNNTFTLTLGETTIKQKDIVNKFVLKTGADCTSRIFGSAVSISEANQSKEIVIDIESGAICHTIAAVNESANDVVVYGDITLNYNGSLDTQGLADIYGVRAGSTLHGTLKMTLGANVSRYTRSSKTHAIGGIATYATAAASGTKNAGKLYGDAIMTINGAKFTNTSKDTYGYCGSWGYVDGDVTTYFNSGTVGNYYGADGTVTGTVTNIFGDRQGTDDVVITNKLYGGMKSGTVGKVVNKLYEDVKVDFSALSQSVYLGGSGQVVNCIENEVYGGTYRGKDNKQEFVFGGDSTLTFGEPTIDGLQYRIKNTLSGGDFRTWRVFTACSDVSTSSTALADDDLGVWNYHQDDPYDGSYIANGKAGATFFVARQSGTKIKYVRNYFKGTIDFAYAVGGLAQFTTIDNYIQGAVCTVGAKSINGYLQLGNNNGGTIGTINNYVESGTIRRFYGAGNCGTVTTVNNYIAKPDANGNYVLPSDAVFEAYFGAGFRASLGNGTVTNLNTTIYGGTFVDAVHLGSYGDSSSYTASATTVKNEIHGGTFQEKVYGGGCNKKASTVGTIHNTISDGEFQKEFFGGSYDSKTTVTNINNKISGAEFLKNVYGGSASGNVTGKITNEFTGTIQKIRYIYGGNNNGTCGAIENTYSCKVLEAAEPGNFGMVGGGNQSNATSIKNTINGAEFECVFIAGCNNGTAETTSIETTFNSGKVKSYTGGAGISDVASVKNVFNGGTVTDTVTCGNSREGIAKSVVNEFNGTIFEDSVYCGGSNSATSTESIVSTVKAGSFVNLYATSNDGTDKDVSLEIVPTDDVTILGEALGVTKFDGTVKIGEDSYIVIANNEENDITVIQTAANWKDRIYVKVEGTTSATIDYTGGANVTGMEVESYNGDTVLWSKDTKGFAGVSLILNDRIQVKVVFNGPVPATYSFTMKHGTVLADEKSGATVGENYVILNGLGVARFDDVIIFTAEGYGRLDLSIIDMTAIGVAAPGMEAKDVALFKAIANLGAVANGKGKIYSDVVDSAFKGTTPGAATTTDERAVQFNGQSLLMSNAIGFRLHGTTDAATVIAKNSVYVYLNEVADGNKINEFCAFAQAKDSTEFTMDIYVHAASMTKTFKVIVTDLEGNEILSMDTSMDALADRVITANPGTETEVLAQQLLNYIYAADACKN